MTSRATRKALRLKAHEMARTAKAAADREAARSAELRRLEVLHLSPAGYWIAQATERLQHAEYLNRMQWGKSHRFRHELQEARRLAKTSCYWSETGIALALIGKIDNLLKRAA